MILIIGLTMAEESIKCLISAATQALETRGAIRTLRAQLLAELFNALEEKVIKIIN